MAAAAENFWDNIFAEEDEERAGEDTEADKFYTTKDAIIFLIDSTPAMFVKNEAGEIPFHNAIKCAMATLTDKIISSDSDLVGICLYGTKKKKNTNEFEGVYIFHDLDNPDAQVILDCESIIAGDKFDQTVGSTHKNFTFSDALWTCSTIFSANRTKVGHRRIFLFTNEDDPNGNDDACRERSSQRARDLSDLGIDIELFSMNKPEKKFDPSVFYQSIITFDEDEDGAAINFDASDKFEELKSRVRRKEFKKRPISSLPFSLAPDVEISVKIYSLISASKKTSFIWLDSRTNESVRSATKWVCEDTGTLLLDSQMRSGFHYGGERIIFDKEDMQKIKVAGMVGLKLLGFKDKSALKVWQNYKTSSFIYPDEHATKGSTVTFAALLDRMKSRDKIAVCRYSLRITTSPSFVALVPQEEIEDEEGVQVSPPGFHMVFLPWAEDIRDITGTEDFKTADEQQIAKAKKIVKCLRIKFDSRNFENPALQKHYAALQAIALEREKIEEISDYVTPDEEGMAKFDEAIEDFASSVFPEEKKTAKRKSPEDAKKSVDEVKIEELIDAEKYTVAELKTLLGKFDIPFKSTHKKGDLVDLLKDYATTGEKPSSSAPATKKRKVDEESKKPAKEKAASKKKDDDEVPAKKSATSKKPLQEVVIPDDEISEFSQEEPVKKKEAARDFSIQNDGEGEDWRPKKMCPYGANCYRRNPDHLKEFRHPGKQKTRTCAPEGSRFLVYRHNQLGQGVLFVFLSSCTNNSTNKCDTERSPLRTIVEPSTVSTINEIERRLKEAQDYVARMQASAAPRVEQSELQLN
ncbi:hypothetical protein PROFUN_08091 [Planoprotostelium fungivorum]|uniref:DNA helicase n=1 Tax=Planoprotostelium fungivorum TaxID=1890364 RepID=A0A2P6NKD0_9EUKA|nr:hypothetical protein PROFUN_08091 [Planoprotostelium fungivorum]